MAMSFGEALAQGLTLGFGQGANQYIADMRRQKADERKVTATFDMFKKQQAYAGRLKAVQAMNVTADQWRTQASKDTNTIAYELATKMSEPFSKEDRPKFFRDSMKQLSGLSKSDLLARGGYVMPDYSQFVDDPSLMEAIPQMTLIGDDGPDATMQEVFKFDPKAYQEAQKEQAQKLTDYDKKIQEQKTAMNDMVAMSLPGAVGVSDRLNTQVLAKLGGRNPINDQGQDLRAIYTNAMLQSGQALIDPADGLLKLADESDTFMEEGPQPGIDVEADPERQAFLQQQQAEKEQVKTEKVEAEERKRMDADSKAIGQALDKNKPMPVLNSIRDAEESLNALDDEALSYLFGAKSLGGDTFRDIASKYGEEAATNARDVVRKLAQIKNIILKERSGAAVTEPEMQRFVEELDQPGLRKSREAILSGLSNLTRLNKDFITSQMAGFSPESKAEFVRREPAYADYIDLAEEGTGDDATNRTLSGLDMSMLEAEDQAFIKEAIASGDATIEDVRAYLQTLQQ